MAEFALFLVLIAGTVAVIALVLAVHLFDRVRRLERRLAGTAPLPAPVTATTAMPAPTPVASPVSPSSVPTPTVPPTPRAPRPPAQPIGGRVLAIAGGGFVIIAALLFFGLAVARGWVTHPMQVGIGYLVGGAALAFGIRLAGQAGSRDIVGRVLAGVGIAIVALTNVVAAQVYDLIAPEVGLVLAVATGSAAVALALRWNSQVFAGFGIVVALIAPPLVGVDTGPFPLAIIAAALAAALVVVARNNWPWLATVALVLTMPQLANWAYDLTRAPQHVVGIVGPSHEPSQSDLVWLALVTGAWWGAFVAANVAADWRAKLGKVRVASYFNTAGATIGVLTVLAFAFPDDNDLLSYGSLLLGVLAIVVAAAFSINSSAFQAYRTWLRVLGLVCLALPVAHLASGFKVDLALAVITLALLEVRFHYGDLRAGVTALVMFQVLLVHTLSVQAPPNWLAYGTVDSDGNLSLIVLIAGLALAAYTADQYATGRIQPVVNAEYGDTMVPDRAIATACATAALLTAFYAASVNLVGALTPDGSTDVSQTAQLALTCFWAAVGVAAVAHGLFHRTSMHRYMGLALLAVASAKVLLFDTAQLESLPRVLSFLGMGLLLLAGGYAYQRFDRDDAPPPTGA